MAGRMDGSDAKAPQLEGIAVLEDAHIVRAVIRPGVLPVSAPLPGEIDANAELLGELAGARKKVGVDVCFGGGDEVKPMKSGGLDVSVYVTLGIDDDRFIGLLAGDQVGILGKALVGDLAEEHDRMICCLRLPGRCEDEGNIGAFPAP